MGLGVSDEGLYQDEIGSGARRVWDIEDALQWVVCDELPKLREEGGGDGASAYIHPMWRQGAFFSRIDNWHRPPGFPAAMGEPDPDALAIAAAVRNLDVARLDLRDTLITYKLAGEYSSAVLLEQARESVQSRIIALAAMKKRPQLDETVHLEKVVSSTGQPTVFRMEPQTVLDEAGAEVTELREVRTRPIRGGTYPEGAYCLYRETPTPAERALLRAEHAVWWIGLQYLARHLEAATVPGKDGPVRLLQRIGLRTPRAPQYPWIEGEAHSPIVRASARGSIDMGGRPMDLSQRRPTARRMPGRRPSEVRRIPVSQYVPNDQRA